MIELAPAVEIASINGTYVVKAVVRCDCGAEDCDGWMTEAGGFTDLSAALEYARGAIISYDSKPEETESVEKAIKRRFWQKKG